MNLKQAIGKEQFLFEDKEYIDSDFLEMSSEELTTFKARILLKVSNIEDLIAEKRETESVDWYKRKKYAKSLLNKMIPYINSLLKRRHNMEHEMGRKIGDCFMKQAKQILPAKEYEAVLDSAWKDYRSNMEGDNAADRGWES